MTIDGTGTPIYSWNVSASTADGTDLSDYSFEFSDASELRSVGYFEVEYATTIGVGNPQNYYACVDYKNLGSPVASSNDAQTLGVSAILVAAGMWITFI